MGQIISTKITRFDGGIVNDPRDPAENTCRMVTGFDILTNPHKMTPYRQSESGDDGAATSKKQNFCVALCKDLSATANPYALFALGVKSGVTNAEVLYKKLTTGGTTDLDDDDWATPSDANNQSGSTFTWFDLFVYYKKTGLIYGARGSSATAGTNIWAFYPNAATAWNDDIITTNSGTPFTFTHIAQGLVFSNDILYIPYNNFIASNDNGTWNNTKLTLPSHLYITSICGYGNYLAIACAPLSGVGNSTVFLWDTTSTSWNEQIDWGDGVLRVIEDVDGMLIGISFTRNITLANYSRFNERVTFKYLSVTNAIKFKELLIDRVHPAVQAETTGLWPAKQKIDNRLYFMMSGVINGRICEGVWSIGRSSVGSSMTLVHERTPNNDTVIPWETSSTGLLNFFILGDYIFIAYESEGTYSLSKTDADELYATSIYETKRFNAGDSSLKKDLIGVTVMTEYLPTAGQVVLKYRIDATTTWSSAVITEATNNSISYSAINSLPKDYKEIEFRIESTGGAEITGLSFKEAITGKRAYD